MKKDELRQVKDYEGLYSVTKDGRVIAHERKIAMPRNGFRIYKERVLKCSILKSGYVKVALYKNGIKKEELVHRLICSAFHSFKSGMQVNHKDGNRQNNDAENLEWVTASQNLKHSYSVLKRSPSRTRPVISIDPISGKQIKRYEQLKDVSKDGFQASNISVRLNSKHRKVGGLLWIDG